MKEADVTPLNLDSEEEINPINTKYKGKIFFINSEAGWGFITSQQIKFRRIYFYWTALDPNGIKFEELHKGAEVEFEASEFIDKITNENKGWRAKFIKVIKNGK